MLWWACEELSVMVLAWESVLSGSKASTTGVAVTVGVVVTVVVAVAVGTRPVKLTL